MATKAKSYNVQHILNKVFTGDALRSVFSSGVFTSSAKGGEGREYTEQDIYNSIYNESSNLLRLT